MKKIEDMLETHELDLKTAIIFHRAERSIRNQENKVFKEMNLTRNQFAVMETLYSKGQLRIQDLIDKILSTSGNMTVVIKNMVRDGYIQKVCDPNDKRSFLLDLTPLGRETIEAVLPRHIENIATTFSILDERDKKDLQRILKKMKDLS